MVIFCHLPSAIVESMLSAATIAQARQRFLTTGVCDESLIAPPIARSWQRSVQAGLDADRPPQRSRTTLTLDHAQETLLTLARPYMEDLYQFMEGSGFAVLLADATLRQIELIGDAEIVEALRALGMDNGSSWAESDIGATAINLALSEALPWQTRGAEHYCACYHHLACSAAPLFDVQGQAMGALGVIGHGDAAHPHTLGMVIAAAQALHAQVRNNLLLAETNEHLAELNAALETINEGLIFLDARGRLSKINSRAGHLLSLSPRSAAGRPLDELIDLPPELQPALSRRREITDQEVVFSGRKGAVALLCSVRPVWDRGRRYLGALITLRPPEAVQRLVQRVVGAQARFTFTDIVGESAGMQAALRHARIAANSQAPILICGEPGVGKELFAHAIHNGGTRAQGPFVALSCAAVPHTLLLGELVGYEGGRTEGRPGKLELAIGGSLLLDEIGDLPIEAQTSLLRAIETQNLVRTNGRRVVPLDVRIIATTSRDLQTDVVEGRFRADLYARLSVLKITIPPLRERGEDILLLINQMLSAMNRRVGKQTMLAPDALTALLDYSWPGNLRELETILDRLIHTTEKSVLTRDDLAPAITQTPNAAMIAQLRLHDRQASAERDAIVRAGREAAGHLGRAADRLGISRATLWRKMKQYGLTKDQFW
jgi:transcriptional activator for dhaKLM operon